MQCGACGNVLSTVVPLQQSDSVVLLRKAFLCIIWVSSGWGDQRARGCCHVALELACVCSAVPWKCFLGGGAQLGVAQGVLLNLHQQACQ